jgi:signal transduction histidine kinase
MTSMGDDREPMNLDRTEKVLHLVIAALWVAAGVFAAVADPFEWRLGALLALQAMFGVLLLLVVRQGHPRSRIRSTVAWQTAIIVVMGLLTHPETVAILSSAVAILAAMRLSRREALTWVLLLVALNLGNGIYDDASVVGFLDGLTHTVGILAFATFAIGLVRARDARRETQTILANLQAAHARLQRYADQVEELAVADERNRISRDLHDTIGHRLTVSIVQLEGASRLVADDPARTTEMIDTVCSRRSRAPISRKPSGRLPAAAHSWNQRSRGS